MTNEKHHIDKYFTDGLENLDVTPPPDVWKNVEKHLDKKRRGGIIGFWSAMAAGLALLIGVGTYLKSDFQTKSNKSEQSSFASIPSKKANNQTLAPKQVEIQSQNKEIKITQTEENTNYSNQNLANSKAKLDAKKTLENNIQGSSNITYSGQTTIGDKNIATFNKIDSATQLATNNLTFKPNPSFLVPFGANLGNNSKQKLIVQPEKITNDTKIITQVEPLQPEIADITEVKKVQRWSVAGQVAPLYSYRTSNQNNTSDQNQEKGLVAYSGGVKIEYKTSRRLSIQTGIFYSVMGQRIDNVKVNVYQNTQSNAFVSGNSINYIASTSNSMGPISRTSNNGIFSNLTSNKFYSNVSNNPAADYAVHLDNITNMKDGSIKQELNFIEIPFLARFKIIDKKVGIHLIGGFSTNFLINNSATLKQDGETENIGQTQGLNPVNYNSTIGFGVNYGLVKNLDLSIEPTYKFYLNSISSYQNVDFRPYSFGLFTGLTYKF